jgi:DNA-binding MarR family transcriptional regulator
MLWSEVAAAAGAEGLPGRSEHGAPPPRPGEVLRRRPPAAVPRPPLPGTHRPQRPGKQGGAEGRIGKLHGAKTRAKFATVRIRMRSEGVGGGPRGELPLALRAAYLAMHRRSDARFAARGVTADQFVLLAALARGDALTQRELAGRMSSDPSTVRAMLVLLARDGFVERERHPLDARARTVRLTPAGDREFRRLWTAGEPIRARMAGALGPAEARTLVDLLNRVTAALAAEPAPAARPARPRRSAATPKSEDER